MAEEWFRTSGWAPEDRAEFERRLRQARPDGRGQYLRIKGLALHDAGELEGARMLWERVLDDPGFKAERHAAMEHLADLAATNDPQRAEALYRQLLEEDPSLNGTTVMAEVSLAELLVREGDPESLREAGELLKAWVTHRASPFPNARFQWEIALVRTATALGERSVARDAARRALQYAQSGAPFPRHPQLGLVYAEAQVMDWLRDVADGPV